MKKLGNICWGLILISIGSILVLNVFGITDIDIFFDGWWTLFIIVPCFTGLFREHDKTGNIIGLLIGVALLLCCQDILSFKIVWKLAFPVILIIVGLSLVFRNAINHKMTDEIKKLNATLNTTNDFCAIFSGQKVNYENQEFKGANFIAVFGGADCYLRNAIINVDQVINCTAIFGGVDIFVPDDVKVKIRSTSIFGGVSDKKKHFESDASKTLYINATCIFGGVDVK